MAIKILVQDKKNKAGAEVDINSPEWQAEAEARSKDRHDPNRPITQWTVPPVSNASVKSMDDSSISLEMGVVYKVEPADTTLLQNVCENEDDKVEFSTHGDPDGTWGLLNPGCILSFDGEVYLLNRTHYENLRVAIIEGA